MWIRDFAHAALAASVLVVAVGCGSQKDPVAVTLPGSDAEGGAGLHVTPAAALLKVGDTAQLAAFAFPTTQVQWATSNSGVATISASGLVTAVAAGTALITANDGAR
jgi:hypothetical protein